MPASIKQESTDIYRLSISGTLEKSEFEAVQKLTAKEIDAGTDPKLLIVLENFEGFELGASWGDLEFLSEHVNDIAKIAIVGDPKWERDALAFAGAGHRKAPVKFFPGDSLDGALEWLV